MSYREIQVWDGKAWTTFRPNVSLEFIKGFLVGLKQKQRRSFRAVETDITGESVLEREYGDDNAP